MCECEVCITTDSLSAYLTYWRQRNLKRLDPSLSVSPRLRYVKNRGIEFYQYRDEVIPDGIIIHKSQEMVYMPQCVNLK